MQAGMLKPRLEQRLAVTQAGSRYMGRSASACGFGWPHECHKAKCIWLARLRAAGLIITAELARQRTIDAAVGGFDSNSYEARRLYCIPH